MEDNFYNDGFEDFLKDQVKNHRMYPSDSVWRNINQNIHVDKKWPALTVVAFLFLIATVTLCVYFSPKPNIFAINPAVTSGVKVNNSVASTSPLIPSNKLDNDFKRREWNGSATSPTAKLIQPTSLVDQPSNTNEIIASSDKPATVKTTSVNAIETNRTIAVNSNNLNNVIAGTYGQVLTTDDTTTKKVNKSLVVTEPKSALAAADAPASNDDNDKGPTDKFLKENASDLALYTTTHQERFKNKFSYQVYITPSVSFRQLREDPSLAALKQNAGGPIALNYVADVNQIVRHKPGMGLEAGFNILYNISNVVRIKSGFQFNARQYSISAFKSGTELAPIALVRNSGIDTVNSLASYRTGSGYSSAELNNRYYQISIPVGIEWEVFGNKRVQFNVSGSIQPTYLLNRNTYLLSTNLKNYTENTGMVRSFNLNSNLEAFMTFKVGDFKWQVGPQLRYQNYSTFIKDYPIHEYLMDYGLKVGVSKLIR